MATRAQPVRANIKKARKTWRPMSSRARATAEPEGRGRAKPGVTGRGEYYHIEVRPSSEFTTFRTQDVGEKGGIERVAGKRSSGSWDTQKWLISKDHARVEDGRIVADTSDAKDVLRELGSKPQHVAGDRFKAKPRPDVPEREKPTAAEQRARRLNIRKAQAAREAK